MDLTLEMSDYGGLLHSMSVFSNALFDGTHIIAFISFSDSMYIFDLEGQLLDEKRLSGYNSFEPLEPFSQELNDEQLLEKMTSYSIITNVFWKDEHTIILEHMKNVNVEQSPFSHSVEYSMAVLNLDGEFLHEDSDFFRAYGYDNASQMLISGHNCITKTAAPMIEYSTLNVE